MYATSRESELCTMLWPAPGNPGAYGERKKMEMRRIERRTTSMLKRYYTTKPHPHLIVRRLLPTRNLNNCHTWRVRAKFYVCERKCLLRCRFYSKAWTASHEHGLRLRVDYTGRVVFTRLESD